MSPSLQGHIAVVVRKKKNNLQSENFNWRITVYALRNSAAPWYLSNSAGKQKKFKVVKSEKKAVFCVWNIDILSCFT